MTHRRPCATVPAPHRMVCTFALAAIAGASVLHAQTLTPNVAEFLPSADHFASLGSSTMHLSDMAWISESNGWGPIERDRSNGETGSSDGRTLTINGVTYQKGLGAHAPSDLTVAIPDGCTTFAAAVGVDDEVGDNGSVVFTVLADGVALFDSGLMTGTAGARSVSVNVEGRRTLRLMVSDGGNGFNYDHADWADARLLCGSSQPVVTGYTLGFYERGAPDPYKMLDVGKPAPQADGLIRVDFGAAMTPWPMPGVESELRVVAVGPGGVGVSAPSNTFVYPSSQPVPEPAPTPGTNVPPTITITRPVDGTDVRQKTIRMEAAAADADGAVAVVRWFANGTAVGESSVAPYVVRWSPASRGTYILTAVAVDDRGAAATSSPVSVTYR